MEKADMAEQYWIGDFFIDLTRNQITQKMQSRTIPPKALAVLTCLAKNANKVVSHDELLTAVWPDTVVTPNTLQRSIAQLRKALGEDSHSYIKTHAKQGYSLEVEVKWQDKAGVDETADDLTATVANVAADVATEAVIDTPEEITRAHSKNATTPNAAFKIVSALVGITFLAVIGYTALAPSPSLKLNIAELNSLTATDKKEYNGSYTPDGQYVVFQRYSESICRNNNLWAKNTLTQQETQLTKNMGAYGRHSFSEDGKTMVFIESNSCDKPVTQKLCYKLMSMDFQTALTEPQKANVLVECKNSRIARPEWISNNNIVLLQEFSNRWKLTSYSVADNESNVIYELEEGNILYFDYSSGYDLIAVTSVHSDGFQYIEILKPDGQVLSSNKIERPKEIAANRFIYPNFTPYAEQLIFSTGRQLFTLSFDGKIANISLPLDEPMSTPTFHPNGKRMLVIKGHYDSDIAIMPLSKVARLKAEQPPIEASGQNSNSQSSNSEDSSANYTVIERSIQREDYAQYQPNGELIAFISSRSGKGQLWVTDGNDSRQISHFPIDTWLGQLDWAEDGQSILINANNQLTRVFLDSRSEAISFPHPVAKFFHWDSENNTALLNARINGVLTFVELNIINGEYKVVNDKKVSWALKSDDGRLIYTDQMERFWRSGPVEDQLIEPLIEQGSERKFISKNNVVYGVNERYQLWSYAINDNTFKVMGNVPETIDYLTDINQSDILFSLRIAARKEVAEIILAD